jgi:uncharacterized membrane protein
MSKSTSKKKVVVTTARKAAPTVSRSKSANAPTVRKGALIFGKKNYTLMLAGIVLIALGLVLMSGGGMPGPDVWDDSIIYSWRRTVLGPLVIIIGLVAEIFAIFNNSGAGDASQPS